VSDQTYEIVDGPSFSRVCPVPQIVGIILMRIFRSAGPHRTLFRSVPIFVPALVLQFAAMSLIAQVAQSQQQFNVGYRVSYSLPGSLLSGSEIQFEVIRHYSIAFLEKYVAGKSGYDVTLERKESLLSRFLRVP
jgi:hypothetical protein